MLELFLNAMTDVTDLRRILHSKDCNLPKNFVRLAPSGEYIIQLIGTFSCSHHNPPSPTWGLITAIICQLKLANRMIPTLCFTRNPWIVFTLDCGSICFITCMTFNSLKYCFQFHRPHH